MAPSTAASPTSLLWAHQLKREHAYLLKRMQAVEAQNNAQETHSVSETERDAVRMCEQAQSEIRKMRAQIENLQAEQRKAAEERKQAGANSKLLMERVSEVQDRLGEYGKTLQHKRAHPDAARFEAIEQQLKELSQQVQSHGDKIDRLPKSLSGLAGSDQDLRSAANTTHHAEDAKRDIANPDPDPDRSTFSYRRPHGQALESRLQPKSEALKTTPLPSTQHRGIESPQDPSHHANDRTDPGVDDATLRAPGAKRRRIEQNTVLGVLKPPTSAATSSIVDSASALSSKINPKPASCTEGSQPVTALYGVVAKEGESSYEIPRPQNVAANGSGAPVAKPVLPKPRKAHCTPQWTQEEAHARGRETRRVKYQPANAPGPVERSGTSNDGGVNETANADVVYLETAPPEPRRRIVQEEDNETFFRYLRGC